MICARVLSFFHHQSTSLLRVNRVCVSLPCSRAGALWCRCQPLSLCGDDVSHALQALERAAGKGPLHRGTQPGLPQRRLLARAVCTGGASGHSQQVSEWTHTCVCDALLVLLLVICLLKDGCNLSGQACFPLPPLHNTAGSVCSLLWCCC